VLRLLGSDTTFQEARFGVNASSGWNLSGKNLQNRQLSSHILFYWRLFVATHFAVVWAVNGQVFRFLDFCQNVGFLVISSQPQMLD